MINEALIFILAALQITLLDIVLSGDNVGVIALAIRNLNPREARLASIIGISGQ
jgi:predicted tellurium resistance membrane protein TerC